MAMDKALETAVDLFNLLAIGGNLNVTPNAQAADDVMDFIKQLAKRFEKSDYVPAFKVLNKPSPKTD